MEEASEYHPFKRVSDNRRERAGAIASGRGMTKRNISSRGFRCPEEFQQVSVINHYLFVYLTQNTQNTKTLIATTDLSIGSNLSVVIMLVSFSINSEAHNYFSLIVFWSLSALYALLLAARACTIILASSF